jgi:hypothetical protein
MVLRDLYHAVDAMVLVTIAYGLYFNFAPRKQYQFFICHHKAGAGAYARLVKLEILSRI